MRRGVIERDHPILLIGAQYRLLPIMRSSFYHKPAGKTKQTLGLMQLNDRQFLNPPI